MLILDLDGSLIRSDDTLPGGPTSGPVTGRRVPLPIGTPLLAPLRLSAMTLVGGTEREPSTERCTVTGLVEYPGATSGPPHWF
jgi:hypothetical protein